MSQSLNRMTKMMMMMMMMMMSCENAPDYYSIIGGYASAL